MAKRKLPAALKAFQFKKKGTAKKAGAKRKPAKKGK